MTLAATLVVVLVALLHAWFLVLEMFLWTQPDGPRPQEHLQHQEPRVQQRDEHDDERGGEGHVSASFSSRRTTSSRTMTSSSTWTTSSTSTSSPAWARAMHARPSAPTPRAPAASQPSAPRGDPAAAS